MPTERFLRLPEEKIEAIRKAAMKEFMRVTPEEASINRIIRDADISRGSFYTYFRSKYDLLKWLFSDKICEHWKFYETTLKENGGDIWDTFSRALKKSFQSVYDGGFMGIIQNLLDSSNFAEMFKEGLDADGGDEAVHFRMQYLTRLFEMTDKEQCPLNEAEFLDLMELHGIILMMTIKLAIRDHRPKEEVEAFYKRRMNLLHYGAASQNMKQKI